MKHNNKVQMEKNSQDHMLLKLIISLQDYDMESVHIEITKAHRKKNAFKSIQYIKICVLLPFSFKSCRNIQFYIQR